MPNHVNEHDTSDDNATATAQAAKDQLTTIPVLPGNHNPTVTKQKVVKRLDDTVRISQRQSPRVATCIPAGPARFTLPVTCAAEASRRAEDDARCEKWYR